MLCPPLGRVAAATAWPLAFACAAAWLGAAPPGRALGPTSQVDLRGVSVGDAPEPRPTARQRLAWEVRKRTSVQTRLEPTATRFDDPSIFATPFLYWSGDRAFRPLRPAELSGLRRFIELGGFLLIDDAGSDDFIDPATADERYSNDAVLVDGIADVAGVSDYEVDVTFRTGNARVVE